MEKRVTRQPAGVEVEETVLKLCPGVTDPNATNVRKETREKNFQEVLPDGTVAQKKIIKTVARLKDVPKDLRPKDERPRVEPQADRMRDDQKEESYFEVEVALPAQSFRQKDKPTPRDEVQERPVEKDHSSEREVTVRTTEQLRTSTTHTDDTDYQQNVKLSKPTVKKTVKTKIRRIGPDGNITEDLFTEEKDLSEPSSPTDREPTSPFLLSLSGPDSDTENPSAIKIYTDTKESEPVIDRQVQEFEEMLPDGTLVRRRIIKKIERRTVTKRIIMEGPEHELRVSAEAHAQELLRRHEGGETSGETNLTNYTDSNKFQPEVKTNLEEFQETLPDGRVVKKRVTTTTQQQLTTERQLMSGTLQELPLGDMMSSTSSAQNIRESSPNLKSRYSETGSNSGQTSAGFRW